MEVIQPGIWEKSSWISIPGCYKWGDPAGFLSLDAIIMGTEPWEVSGTAAPPSLSWQLCGGAVRI